VRLGVDPDELAACVSCGLCLAHCPTYRATGEESRSPRGRIAAMRLIDSGEPPNEAFVEMMTTCVQCRACETACPSAVPFGRLMEGARQLIADQAVPSWQRAAYRVLAMPRLLRAATTAGALAQRMRLLPPRLESRLGLPKLPLRARPLSPTGTDVWLFTGCIMDAWMRPTHASVVAVLEAMGVGVALPGPGAACCGALHGHAGLSSEARRLARRVMSSFPGEAPVLVDSAGCGAALKDYGHLLGTQEAQRFSSRVQDVGEYLAAHAERLPEPRPGWRRPTVAVADPCHLRHVQKAHTQVRVILAPYAELVELADEGRCCGAGGAFSVLRPELASAIREEKVKVIEQSGAAEVASANPGCALWLAGAGLAVRHPVDIMAEAAGLT